VVPVLQCSPSQLQYWVEDTFQLLRYRQAKMNSTLSEKLDEYHQNSNKTNYSATEAVTASNIAAVM
jgi:hypothetical protein